MSDTSGIGGNDSARIHLGLGGGDNDLTIHAWTAATVLDPIWTRLRQCSCSSRHWRQKRRQCSNLTSLSSGGCSRSHLGIGGSSDRVHPGIDDNSGSSARAYLALLAAAVLAWRRRQCTTHPCFGGGVNAQPIQASVVAAVLGPIQALVATSSARARPGFGRDRSTSYHPCLGGGGGSVRAHPVLSGGRQC